MGWGFDKWEYESTFYSVFSISIGTKVLIVNWKLDGIDKGTLDPTPRLKEARSTWSEEIHWLGRVTDQRPQRE